MTTTCPDCRGEGQIIKDRCRVCAGRGWNRSQEEVTVKIPAGVASGMKLRVSGKGKPSAQGGANGDLFVILNIEEHDMFQRVDNELLAELNISMVDACLGTEMNFESLDGQVLVTVEPGTQAGSIIRVSRRGMPDVSSGRRGDLHLRVQVDIPTSLSNKQRELLTAFREA